MYADETLKCHCIMCITPPVHVNCKSNSLIIYYIYDLSGFSSFFPVVDIQYFICTSAKVWLCYRPQKRCLILLMNEISSVS